MRHEFRLPDVGEGLTEAEIVNWHVKPGDTVTVNQVLVEIETAKAVVELPSPYAGVVGELLVAPGETVAVGTPIIAIETAGTAAAAAAADLDPGVPAEVGGGGDPGGAPAEPAGAKIGEAGADGRIATLVGYGPRPGTVHRRARRSAPPAPAPQAPEGSNGDRVAPAARATTVPLAKPPVRKLARDLGVDLYTLTGTGTGGVITREDVQAAATAPETVRPETAAPPTAAALASTAPAAADRREPIRGVRRATAEAMVASAFTAPHVTEFLTVDVTETMALRERLRATRAYADVALTPLAFVAKAVCLAARRTPVVNASWDEAAGEIVYHGRVQLGIAAATPRGLIVPKVRDADTLDLLGLARALAELTATARAGKTAPADLVNGTFTITNVGVFGVDTGTPIINPGEAAILAVGSIKPAPWVVDGELAVRTVCQLALSFDHRLVDGEQGSRFLADVGAVLTDPGLALTW
ncbi:dihydrolipoamide acetyltransferase family protein [Pseudonocardia sp.]|uniref:dihydrolipoamide acetyltransferase family protein n=1 Tax=Pseudonocardia sp. TaxID=60912 RepID=UPI003D11C46C